MRIESYRALFICVFLITSLVFALPTLSYFIKVPEGEHFTEIYLLGPNHNSNNIPYTIKPNVPYSIYLGLINHMGEPCYYISEVKFRNETSIAPNINLHKPSIQPSLYDFYSFVSNQASWEAPFTFEISNMTVSNGISTINNITLNGIDIPLKETAPINIGQTGYTYFLFFELWRYNSSTGQIQFDGRFVQLKLIIAP
jgi:uncharacterized membrane protein